MLDQDGIIIDFAPSPTPVSALTVLFPFTQFGYANKQNLMFAVVNLDPTNPCSIIVESSEDGVHPDSDPNSGYNETKNCPAGGQASFVTTVEDTMRSYWRLSAQTASPLFPVVNVKWRVKALKRL